MNPETEFKPIVWCLFHKETGKLLNCPYSGIKLFWHHQDARAYARSLGDYEAIKLQVTLTVVPPRRAKKAKL